MVQYLASVSNEISITVRSVQVGTTLTLTGPVEVMQGANFTLTATLKRNDTQALIQGASVKFYQSLGGTIRTWTLVGSGVTGADDKASLVTTTIYAGSYYYKAEFEGATYEGLTFMPSVGFWDYTVGGVPLIPVLAVLGLAYLLTRK